MKRVFVTGGAGFLGSGIIKKLLENNYKVICFDDFSRGALRKIKEFKKKIKIVSGDVRDKKKVIKYSQNCDIIIHLAFINGTEFFYSKPDLVLDVGIKGMLNVIEASKINKIKELILASSSEVYQTPNIIPTPEQVALTVPDVSNPRYSYGAGKIISEVLAYNSTNHLKRMMIFRPHNVYGPDMGTEHVIPQLIIKFNKLLQNKKNIKRLNFPILGDGEQIRAFNYIDDFSDGVIKILKKGKDRNIYHIGDSRKYKIKQLVQKLEKIFNKKVKLIKKKAPMGETKVRCPNINKMRKIGYFPKTSLDDGLKKTVKWYLNNL